MIVCSAQLLLLSSFCCKPILSRLLTFTTMVLNGTKLHSDFTHKAETTFKCWVGLHSVVINWSELECFLTSDAVFAGKMYGRGSTDDKGPVLAWFNCIEAYQKINQVKFLVFLLHDNLDVDDNLMTGMVWSSLVGRVFSGGALYFRIVRDTDQTFIIAENKITSKPFFVASLNQINMQSL